MWWQGLTWTCVHWPDKPPTFSQLSLVRKMLSKRAAFSLPQENMTIMFMLFLNHQTDWNLNAAVPSPAYLCSCMSLCVPSPQLNRYLQQREVCFALVYFRKRWASCDQNLWITPGDWSQDFKGKRLLSWSLLLLHYAAQIVSKFLFFILCQTVQKHLIIMLRSLFFAYAKLRKTRCVCCWGPE